MLVSVNFVGVLIGASLIRVLVDISSAKGTSRLWPCIRVLVDNGQLVNVSDLQ